MDRPHGQPSHTMTHSSPNPRPSRTTPWSSGRTPGLPHAADDRRRIAATAQLILAIFDDFYSLLCEYPYRAKCAFESMDPHASIRISKERLALYSRYIAEHGPRLRAAWPALADDSRVWDALTGYSSR